MIGRRGRCGSFSNLTFWYGRVNCADIGSCESGCKEAAVLIDTNDRWVKAKIPFTQASSKSGNCIATGSAGYWPVGRHVMLAFRQFAASADKTIEITGEPINWISLLG